VITLKLFGLLKSLAHNQTELALPIGSGGTVLDVVGLLDREYQEIAELVHKKKVLISVNLLNEGDEVALLPPFAGGSETSAADDMLVRIQREDFSIDAELARIRARSRRIGGIAIFLGTARDRSKGRDVNGIKFEYYEGMAQKKLREIRDRALKDFDIIDVLIVHRYGEIEIGDNIVLVIAAAEHREEAFRACKWGIDELKQITPIWKQESTPEGEIWVEEHP